jgi:hypothetical protein
MSKTGIRLFDRAPQQRVGMMFPFKETRPALGPFASGVYRAVSEYLRSEIDESRLTKSERAAILLLLCVDEVEEEVANKL